jgi:hypothetical protein
MAKVAAKAGGMSRVRFVMFDAEVAEGEIGQITQAIQNALRGTVQVTTQRLPAPAALRAPEANGLQTEPEGEFEQDEEVVDVTAATPRPRAPRKVPKAPNIIDIEMTNDVSFASFAQGKDAGSQHKKYLICAAWLKEHRNIDAVSDKHIYTCFRSIGWSTNIPDFAQPLRELKSRKFFAQPEKGLYAINHIGLDYVKKLCNGGE